MKNRERVDEIFKSLQQAGLQEAEAFLKVGRSRQFEIGLQGKAGSSTVERGWAIRAGGPRSSFFLAGTGVPRVLRQWPDADGQPLRLPDATPIPDWRHPSDLDHSLGSESEALALLSGIERALLQEVPGARMIRAQLEEGTSETSIFSTTGIEVDYRSRAAALFVEVTGPWEGSPTAALSLAERDHRAFQPAGIAKRLANRILLARQGGAPAKERGDVLIGSAVAARILTSLLPLLLGVEAEKLAQRFRDRQGQIGSQLLTIIDDGRFVGGVLESPVDGEGLPTDSVVLIDKGNYRRSLADWRQRSYPGRSVVACTRRESWRDVPIVGPSHLYIEPQTGVGVGDLLQSVTRGYYLLEALGPGQFDFAGDRFRIPVCGFVLSQGQATAPLSRTWLEGGITTLLRNIRAVARDLTFQPQGAMIGAPSLLVTGLGLRAMD